MLRLILGRAGSSKTFTIHEEIAREIAVGGKGLILLVPEQYSFESERELLHRLGEKDAAGVQVLNFSRLITEVGRRYGGFAGRRIDDSGRMVMMGLALEKVADMLTLYRRFSKSPEFAVSMLSAVSEFKKCALAPNDLTAAANRLPDGALKFKVSEMATIMGAYEALVGSSYLDGQDDLSRLAELLCEADYFRGKKVFLDSFKGFTEQQFRVLSQILRQADDVAVSLTTDALSGEQDGFGLFANVKATARRLIELAKERNVKVAPPVYLEPGRRFLTPALKALEQGLFSPDPAEYDGKAEEVTIFSAQTLYDEADYVARGIRRLVREQGYRYREIAVIAREMDTYRGVIDGTFEKYGIPCYLDARHPVDTQPLMRLVTSALAAAVEGFSSDDLFQVLKTGLTGFSVEEIAELENYVFVWNISGKRWFSEWTGNPDGFSEQNPENAERLARINELRRRATAPLQKLQNALASSSVRKHLLALYRFLEDVGAAGHLRRLAKELEDDGEVLEAANLRRTWDLLMHLFDQLALSLQHSELTPRRTMQLLQMVIEVQELGSVPPELDEVMIGSAERMRPASPRAVFIMGANEGVFPKTPGSEGLLTSYERIRLIEAGLSVTDNSEKTAIDEQYLAYTAVCAASERVTVTYPRADSAGKALAPSEIVTQIRSIVKNCAVLSEANQTPLGQIEAVVPAAEFCARGWNSMTPFSAALKAYLSSRDEMAGFFRRIQYATRKTPVSIDPATAKRLYGNDVGVSASRIETFFKCPFSYFCRYGLGAQRLKSAEMDVLLRGTLSHLVLERILLRHPDDFCALPADLLKDEVHEIFEDYLANVLGGYEEKSARFLFTLRRMEMMLLALVEQLQKEFSQSEFTPKFFELAVDGGKIKPEKVLLPDGGSVSVYGVIDRVDTYQKDGRTYLRVVDYKTGTRDFKLYDVLYGHNLQMLIYLFTLCENADSLFEGEAVPAGILYMPVRRSIADADSSGSQADERELAKKLRMSGLLLDDPSVVAAMESKGEGVFIPAKLNKDGSLSKTSSVADARRLSMIHRHIRALLVEMGQRLHRGDAAVEPLDGSKGACDYCEFLSVCKKDPHSQNPVIPKADANSVFALLEEKYDQPQDHGLPERM